MQELGRQTGEASALQAEGQVRRVCAEDLNKAIVTKGAE